MNAVAHMAHRLSPAAVRRLAALRVHRFATQAQLAMVPRDVAPRSLDIDEARAAVCERWGGDLCGLLNAMTRGELAELARTLEVTSAPAARSSELRMQLWHAGAAVERAGADAELMTVVQPRPIILGGHLVVQAPPCGLYPASPCWPRAVPPSAAPRPPADEPDSLDELLAAADRTIGVRLGKRGRDKGAWGLRAAALLGLVERGHDEPDWRGDVEVKTVPVALDPSGAWRVVEDPAIAMLDGGGALAKLQHTLWLVRANVGDADATILSWYLLEGSAEIARLVRRYLHDRPKGPAGTAQRGLYLHKRFFAEAGLLATLNGPAPRSEVTR